MEPRHLDTSTDRRALWTIHMTQPCIRLNHWYGSLAELNRRNPNGFMTRTGSQRKARS
jgi:hypothetical protein